jgi:dTDP-4-dehydrorhamnose reductase
MVKQRILILGANGMIGHKMYQVLSHKFSDVWALSRKNIDFEPYGSLFVSSKYVKCNDLSNFEDVLSILDSINPDVIINAVGVTIRRGINDLLSYSIRVNSALPHFLGEWVNRKKSKRLIHFSTDCVFSGKSGSYLESTIPDAFDYYGKTKGLGEIITSQCLTLRGSMIGRELEYHTELLEWFLSQKGKTIKGFSNALYSGISTIQMAEYVSKIISDFPEMSGLYNVSSIPISKFNLLQLFKKEFQIDVEIVNDTNYISKKDLISERFYQDLGISIPSWNELVITLKEDSILNKAIYKN